MLKKYSVRHVSSEAGKLFRYLGPGILITVGFIDPGNWAANIAAGSGFGYSLLWMVTLSTIMLVFLQHNVAHLGIVTGLCLAEAATTYLPLFLSRFLLLTAVAASIATALAEILGGALAISMLTGMPVIAAALFFSTRSDVTEIAQAQIMLEPMLGKGAALLFAVALFLLELRLLRRPAWPAVQSTRESSGKRIILRIIIRGTV